MGRRKQAELIRGTAKRRRTEGDDMGVLLDSVSLDDWRGVVTGALRAAKGGEGQGWRMAGHGASRKADKLSDRLGEMLAKPINALSYTLVHNSRAIDCRSYIAGIPF